MDVRLLFFAALREQMGTSEQLLRVPASARDIAGLRAYLEQTEPRLEGRLGSVRFAINEVFCDDSSTVSHGDVVALIPPVSGG